MSLIKCSECGSRISSKAPSCPRCGCPKGEVKPQETGCGMVLLTVCTLLTLLAVFIGIIRNRLNSPYVDQQIVTAPPPAPQTQVASPSSSEISVLAKDSDATVTQQPPKADSESNISGNTSSSGVEEKPAETSNGGNPLDVFMRVSENRGTKLIDRYQIKDGVLYIDLNDACWDGFDKSQQHRVCDMLAQADFIDKMNVTIAYLTLDGEMTKVGDISHVAFGPHCVFNPNDDYWKYR